MLLLLLLIILLLLLLLLSLLYYYFHYHYYYHHYHYHHYHYHHYCYYHYHYYYYYHYYYFYYYYYQVLHQFTTGCGTERKSWFCCACQPTIWWKSGGSKLLPAKTLGPRREEGHLPAGQGGQLWVHHPGHAQRIQGSSHAFLRLLVSWCRHQIIAFLALLVGHQWIPLTKASDAEVWRDLRLNIRLNKQSRWPKPIYQWLNTRLWYPH